MTKTKVAIVKGNKNPDDREIDALTRRAIELAGCPPNGRNATSGMGVNVGITNIDTLSQ